MPILDLTHKERPLSLLFERKPLWELSLRAGADAERQELFRVFLGGLRDLSREVELGACGESPEKRREAHTFLRRLYENCLEGRETEVFTLVREEKIPTKAQHYNRNRSMPLDILPQTPEEAGRWGWNDGVAADCHQFTSPDRTNRKYV